MTTEHRPADVPALTEQIQQEIPRPSHIAARRTPGNAMGTPWRRPLILLMLLVTCGIAACSSSSSAAAPATTAAAAAATTAAATTAAAVPATTAAAAPATATPAASGDTIPEYKPSTVLSSVSGTTVLKSPDSVAKVAAFYENALKSGGWQWHTTARSAYSAHFEAAKGSAHAVIQISSAGQGVSIAVTITK